MKGLGSMSLEGEFGLRKIRPLLCKHDAVLRGLKFISTLGGGATEELQGSH